MSIAILHDAGNILRRYEEELQGIIAAPEEHDQAGAGPSGGGEHEPLTFTTADPDYKLLENEKEANQRLEEKQRIEKEDKERTEERQREEREHREERVRQEHENHEERERQERENRENRQAEQATTPPPVSTTSSRTSTSTGRKR